MRTIKVIFAFFFLVAVFGLTSGCTMKNEHTSQIRAEVLRCPPGTKPDEKCVIEYKGPTYAMGGGRVTAVFESGGQCRYEDKHGNPFIAPCGTTNLAVAVKADRVDTVVPAVISGTADVLSARQIRLGNENAARESSKAGPGMLIINDNDANSGSSSSAAAVTDTDIGIEQTETTCSDCFEPPTEE